eukprot:5413332-Amphidinium_carterae.2
MNLGGLCGGYEVFLNFEPRTATDAEGLNMMFQAADAAGFIFNALSRQYHLMHEHRNLSAGSFTRYSMIAMDSSPVPCWLIPCMKPSACCWLG